ncbi:MAG: glycine cleavage system protein R [Phycisphaerae bacterium]
MPNRYQHVYVLNVISDDHPGIVASVGTAIKDLGGNIDACSQTVLRGYFTLIMIVSVPENVDPRDLQQRVASQTAGGSELQVTVRRFGPIADRQAAETAERFVVTAFGEDTPGVVLKFSRYLAGKDINIVDLYGQRQGGQFMLISQVEIPARLELSHLQAELAQMGRDSGFTVRLQHENIFVATNQLRLKPLAERAPLRLSRPAD